MEILIAFLVGIATSGIVGFSIYKRQRKDSTLSEQRLAFILEQALKKDRKEAQELHSTMAALSGQQREMQHSVEEIRSSFVNALRAFADDLNRPSLSSRVNGSLRLTIHDLKKLHRTLMPETVRDGGQIRHVDIRIEGTPYTPPNAETIPELLSDALNEWNMHADNLTKAPRTEQIHQIAKLHHKLLLIHPFLDGNGALARTLLSINLSRMTGRRQIVTFGDRERYYQALQAADGGNLGPLESLIYEIADADDQRKLDHSSE